MLYLGEGDAPVLIPPPFLPRFVAAGAFEEIKCFTLSTATSTEKVDLLERRALSSTGMYASRDGRESSRASIILGRRLQNFALSHVLGDHMLQTRMTLTSSQVHFR